MENYHDPVKSKTSGTGGKRRKNKDKKLAHLGSSASNSRLGEKEVRQVKKLRGNGIKVRLKTVSFINLLTPKGIQKVKMRNVVETPDNRHHARQNVITLGTIVDTEAGKAKVTNRVGQDGVVNGRLL
ncbi:MAG: 30S ribosomal protein S8e [Candidatus Micrarchaeota archaeon]